MVCGFHLCYNIDKDYLMSTTQKDRKLLDEVHDVMRLLHYSIHTECDWIKQYIRFHKMMTRQDLAGGEAKIEAFLTYLAVEKAVFYGARPRQLTIHYAFTG